MGLDLQEVLPEHSGKPRVLSLLSPSGCNPRALSGSPARPTCPTHPPGLFQCSGHKLGVLLDPSVLAPLPQPVSQFSC